MHSDTYLQQRQSPCKYDTAWHIYKVIPVAIPRQTEQRLNALLASFPAVALLGPRQVGKTTLARAVADRLGPRAVYLDLELPEHRARLEDAARYLRAHQERLVVLDEIHRAPQLFRVLRGAIDERRRAGRQAGHFLVLGSASMDLLRQSGQSLAGRLSYLELTPFLATEAREGGAEERLWSRGGFPGSFLAADDAPSYQWRRAFIRTYLERDIPELGPRIPAETLRRFWTMLAHSQGGPLNAARLAAGLGVSGHTVARYLDLLVDLLLVRRLPPLYQNVGKRLVKSPKIYVRDSGIAHALLDIRSHEQLLGHPVAGPSWEGYVVENLIACAPAWTQALYYRTAAGAEVDLVLEFSLTDRWAIEIKRGIGAAPSRGFHAACDDLRISRRFLVYPGGERYALDRRTTALPLEALMGDLAGLAK